MSDRFVRKLMLDQQWNFEKGYVKPLHFPSSKLSKTFYSSAKNQSNYHFGILGELTHSTCDENEVIKTVDQHFREAVSSFDDINQVVTALCQKLDETHNDLELSFQIWARHKTLNHIPVISMGMPTLNMITRDLKDVVMTFDAKPYQSQKKPSYTCAYVPIAETKYLIFTTDTSCLPKRSTITDLNSGSNFDTIFDLSSYLNDGITDRECVPNTEGDVSLILMDLHDFTVLSETTFYGLDDFESEIERILSSIPGAYEPFAVKLILSELLMNAHKHGNDIDQNLPIKVIVSKAGEELILEVLDMRIRIDDIPIITDITEANILDEHGRGLYLVNAFSDRLTIDNHSVVSRIKCKNKSE